MDVRAAWVDTQADLVAYPADLVASPTIEALPLPKTKEERQAIAEREQDRKRRGIGFAPDGRATDA